MLHVFFHAWKIHTLLVSGQSTLLVRTIEMAPSVVAAFFGAWKLSKTCRPVAVCRCIQLWDDVTIMCELKQKARFCNFSLMKSVSNFWPVKSIGLGPSIWITYMCNIFKCIVYKHPHTMLQKTSWISHPPNFCLLSRNDWFLLHNHGFTWHLKHLRCYRCLRQWSKNNLIKKGTVQHIWIIMYHNIFANIEIYKRKIIINFTNIIDTYILTCTCVRYSIETTRLFFLQTHGNIAASSDIQDSICRVRPQAQLSQINLQAKNNPFWFLLQLHAASIFSYKAWKQALRDPTLIL